ncbi:hypothetical protein K438DRAFT_1763217 [Mycena galopus ATCC 62051]|nr:hypothetical protein K438DRAFT_1763217 [Mycena galopus ATCC 62051]
MSALYAALTNSLLGLTGSASPPEPPRAEDDVELRCVSAPPVATFYDSSLSVPSAELHDANPKEGLYADDPDPGDWFVTVSGTIGRNCIELAHLHALEAEESGHDISHDPIYYAMTFRESLKYLPLCRTLRKSFKCRAWGHGFELKRDAFLFYVVDGAQGISFSRLNVTSEDAELRWKDIVGRTAARPRLSYYSVELCRSIADSRGSCPPNNVKCIFCFAARDQRKKSHGLDARALALSAYGVPPPPSFLVPPPPLESSAVFMSLKNKCKKATVINFSRNTQAVKSAGSSSSGSIQIATEGVLREKTSISQSGAVRQDRTIVAVPLGSEGLTRIVHPDVRRPHEPIYEPYIAADHGGDEDDEEEGGHNLRDSVFHHFV